MDVSFYFTNLAACQLQKHRGAHGTYLNINARQLESTVSNHPRFFHEYQEVRAYLEQLCKFDGQVGRHLVVTVCAEGRLSPRSVLNDNKNEV